MSNTNDGKRLAYIAGKETPALPKTCGKLAAIPDVSCGT